MPRPKRDAPPRVRPLWSDHAAYLLVYRIVLKMGREVRVMVGERLPPTDVPDEAALKALYGPGWFVVSPRVEDGRIAGEEKRVCVPEDDGSLPRVQNVDEAQAPVTQGPGWGELLKMQEAHMNRMNAMWQGQLLAAREERKADLGVWTAVVESLTKQGAGGDDWVRSRLESLEKSLDGTREALGDAKLKLAAKDGDASALTEILREASPLVERMLPERKRGRQERAPAPPALPASLDQTDDGKLLAALPAAEVLAAAVDRGDLSTDDLAVLLRLARGGTLPGPYAAVLRRGVALCVRDPLPAPAPASPGGGGREPGPAGGGAGPASREPGGDPRPLPEAPIPPGPPRPV